MAEVIRTTETKGEDAGRWTTWADVQNDPLLRDLPFKIETNARGQIIMSPPAAPKHGGRQFELGRLIRQHLDAPGKIVTECPVHTPGGTKVPDVAWFSGTRWDEVKDVTGDSPVAPEICVEILSPSNTEAEMTEKRQLYFEAGAEEVWLCDTGGAMHFFGRNGAVEASKRVPNFPKQIDI